MNDRPTFEETYPKHEFSELVRLGLVVARWILGRLHLGKAPARDAPVAPARNAFPAE
jgi:hypothetical protein